MKLKSLMAIIALLCFGNSFSQTFEVKANSERQIKDSIIITDTFLLRQNSTLSFDPALKSCNINCNVFIAEKGAKVNGKGSAGQNGKNGQGVGTSGTAGQNGNSGIKLKIQTSTFSYCNIIIDVSGSTGGIGGVGVKGKKGRNASCCTGGAGGGGTGGSGGAGGNGGNGGSIRLKYTKINSLCGLELGSSNFVLTGGQGNKGGTAGSGGDGGNRASGCFPGCNKPGGSSGSAGSAGQNGTKGNEGTIITE